jgi:hypothetical protein
VSDITRFQIPTVDLRVQYSTTREQVRRAIDEVNDSQQIILGSAVSISETEMAAYLRCEHAVGVTSGSDALLLALMALEIGPGDAVITTPFTFFFHGLFDYPPRRCPVVRGYRSGDLFDFSKGHKRFSRGARPNRRRRDQGCKNRLANQSAFAGLSLRPVLRHA